METISHLTPTCKKRKEFKLFYFVFPFSLSHIKDVIHSLTSLALVIGRSLVAHWLLGTMVQIQVGKNFLFRLWVVGIFNNDIPPASEAGREVANLTWRKNPPPPIYGVKEFVCLSVCDEFWPQLLTLTCTINKGVWNFPNKFHLYVIIRL